ncbi:hypothetical protein [Ruegeria arenilitoris]|uniref:hypothetical protein n=1 Tax=Ruegeria arenilitoris TaxID=1173585 RepID=UPI00147F60A7|nr:hypothetical protein [Ruegeria arenilitoris]
MTDHDQLAVQAYQYITDVARPFVARGGRLWTKTPGFEGIAPATTLRDMLAPLDADVPVTLTTEAAALAGVRIDVEHVLPVKRIAIEMIDPLQGDPRCGSNRVLIGRAESPADVLRIYLALAVKCYVTNDEHKRLNRAHRSSKWDAWNGDWRERYKRAGVVVMPVGERNAIKDILTWQQ